MTTEVGTRTLARIEQALSLESREATIHDVKRAVIDEIEKVDGRVKIRSTDYFRHTYAPDLILGWQDDIDRRERWVFLRSKVSPAALEDDLGTLGREQPIIFGLGASSAQGRDESVRERSAATGTLITDPIGFNELVPPATDAQIPQLVSRMILRGGRGVYDERSTTETTQTIARGFEAAFDTVAEDTFAGARSIRSNLGEHSGDRLLRLLHAIWVGSGGRSDLFPDAPALGGPLSDDALELLLDGPDNDDVEFWRRIGSVTLQQLSRLRIGDRPANLGRLLLAHADSIEGRWCRVRPDEPRTGGENNLQWGIEAGAVALHGPTFSAYLASDKSGIDGVEAISSGGISIDTLTQRAEAANAEISDVTATGGGLIVEVASESHGNVLDNPHASGTVGAAAGNVTRATATLPNGRVVVCDLASSTASSRTKGTLTLRELIRHGLPLVWSLAEDEMESLDAMLTPVVSGVLDDSQLSLLDLLPNPGSQETDASSDEDD